MERVPDGVVLIDYENLAISSEQSCGHAPDLQRMMDAVRGHCRPVVMRAYGDWDRHPLRGQLPTVYRAGIEPVFMPGKRRDGSLWTNAADIRLSIDATDLHWSRPNLDTYIFVTGDSDFRPVVSYLRERGRQVIVLALGSALSQALAVASDAVIIYERLVPTAGEEPREDPSALPAPAKVSVLGDLSEGERDTLLTAIQELEKRNAYLAFRFVVDQLYAVPVLERLSKEELYAILNDLVEEQIVLRSEGHGCDSSGKRYTFTKLSVNRSHPLVRTAGEDRPPTPRPLSYRPFACLQGVAAQGSSAARSTA